MQRILGTETEFGVASHRLRASDPVEDSLRLIGGYPSLPAPGALWDYENENPLRDARGFEVQGERERPGPAYNRALNKLLANAGRLYVDGAHPEYATPECGAARDLVAYERAGELVVAKCLEVVNRTAGGNGYALYKNNSDGKGNSYGYHENYLMSRAVPFDTIVRTLLPFFVSRPIFAGAGKVGSENGAAPAQYQISQRADFFERLVDLNTMVKRPMVNTRDEPHADGARFRRLHVIVGDANMAELSTYLKVGTTAIVTHMLDEGAACPPRALESPLDAIKIVSRDLTVKADLKLADGGVTNALDIQRAYLGAAQDFYACRELSPATKDILMRWETVLDKLEQDPRQLAGTLDWVAKRHMIESYLDRKGYGWESPQVALLDLQYHDVRPDKGLYYMLERNRRIERLLDDEDIARAEFHAPRDTRAYFRGACLRKFPRHIHGASWTSVLLDVGDASVKRVPLMDPLRGTRDVTEELFDGVETARDLLARLV